MVCSGLLFDQFLFANFDGFVETFLLLREFETPVFKKVLWRKKYKIQLCMSYCLHGQIESITPVY